MSHDDNIARLKDQGFCVLKAQYTKTLVAACRQAFWPILLSYLESHHLHPNRGPHRHSLPMPFEPPCFAPEFFFDADVLSIVHGVLGERIVADQWSCDVPVRGSVYQKAHADFQRPLFAEYPDFVLPAYMLVVSFGLIDITPAHGPLEIAARTHRMPRHEALRAVEAQEIEMEPVLLALGDVLIRHLGLCTEARPISPTHRAP